MNYAYTPDVRKDTMPVRNETWNARHGMQAGEKFHYFTCTVYTFWDDDPFGCEYGADTLSELNAELAAEKRECLKRAKYINDGYLPAKQAFSHSRITRVNVTVA